MSRHVIESLLRAAVELNTAAVQKGCNGIMALSYAYGIKMEEATDGCV